ncbi:hypothetical protein [Nostoc sp.]|uniref:hypothetical protein n=1 Tax=Nostoc sp. TaxID=1180 RepID=UPI002FF62991
MPHTIESKPYITKFKLLEAQWKRSPLMPELCSVKGYWQKFWVFETRQIAVSTSVLVLSELY